MPQLDLCAFYSNTPGTGPVAIGSALAGLLTPAAAGAVHGAEYDYSLSNSGQREAGYGTYDSGAGTITRTLVRSTTGSLLNLSGTSEVRITPRAASFFEGPASATDEHVAVFDGTTGKKVKGGGSTIAALTASILATVRDGVSSSFDTLAELAAGKLDSSNPAPSGYIELSEIASPSNPAADKLRLFLKDVGGLSKLFTRNSAGLEEEIGSGGAAQKNYLINGGMQVRQRQNWWGFTVADDVYCMHDRWNALCETTSATSPVTFTNGSANIGWTGHNRTVGDTFQLTTTGTLPTNFALTTTYYVLSVVNANTITVSSKPGGSAVSAGSAGSGTHTATGRSLTSVHLTDVEDGTPFMMRLLQNNGSAQRFGVEQIIEGATCKELRGKSVTLSARVRCSASTTLRYAVLEWTGTEDAVTSDVVNSWSNGTFTAGQFFLGSNLTVSAVGSLALTAATLADVSLTAILGSSLNNLIVFFWTDSTQAQNVTLDIGKVKLEAGTSVTPFAFKPKQEAVRDCQRYFQKSYNTDIAPQTFNNYDGASLRTCQATFNYVDVGFSFATEMRATPTMVFYAPATGNVGLSADGVDKPVNGYGGTHAAVAYVNNSSTSANQFVGGHFVAQAEL